MQQKNDKQQKTLILVGGANIFLIICHGLCNAVEAIRNRSILRLFNLPSSLGALGWIAINLAILWKFHEIGKSIRWPQNMGNSVTNTAYSTFNKGVSIAKSLVGSPSDHVLPTEVEVEIAARVKMGNVENVLKNIVEGGAATYDTFRKP